MTSIFRLSNSRQVLILYQATLFCPPSDAIEAVDTYVAIHVLNPDWGTSFLMPMRLDRFFSTRWVVV